jgi:hypothetical protein
MPKSLLKLSLLVVFLAFAVSGRVAVFAQSPTPQATPSPTPLTAGGKMEFAARGAFLNPFTYVSTGLGATITEVRERRQPQKDTDDRIADGLSRFAINFGTGTASTLLGSGVYPVIFKQDPRYFPSNKKGFGPRAAYAMSRVFVTRGDNGRDQPNYSRLAGNFSASALANIWERDTPGANRIGMRPTLKRFGTSIASNMISNIIFKEFWPDIKSVLKKK